MHCTAAKGAPIWRNNIAKENCWKYPCRSEWKKRNAAMAGGTARGMQCIRIEATAGTARNRALTTMAIRRTKRENATTARIAASTAKRACAFMRMEDMATGIAGQWPRLARGHGFEAEASDDLYALMRACGHILYHQGGRKSGQGRILRILSHCEAMSQRELQEVLGIQTGSLSEILAKLENAGFIERERDEADRRRSVVRLTPAGRNRAEECCRNGERQDMFSALDEGQREQLKKLLTILLADWKA